MMRVTFLGTSAAQPTLSRNLSGISVRREHEHLLFDCGEGSQRQMMRYGTGFAVDRIFFTHFHGDHFLGLLGFLRTLNMQGRVEPLHLYGPSPAASLLDRAVHLGFDPQSFEILVHELAGGAEVVLPGASVTAVPVEHRIPALGYVLREADRPGEFHPEKAVALGVPEGPLFGELQRGAAVVVGGRRIGPDEVLGPSRRGRSFVVSGDTRPCEALERASRAVDVLIHEATFIDADQPRALETNHSTAREAAALAARAGVRRLLLTHFSSRYEDGMSGLLAEARAEFAGVELAYDGLTFDVPLP
jgi:ribonuclease Z